MKKYAAFFVLFLLCLGCASEKVALLEGMALDGAPVCLENRSQIPALVRKFYATRDLTTEEGKIDYLIERVRTSSLVFIRNQVHYSGPGAAEFLRWKLRRLEKRWHVKVETAQDFVSQVASGSRMSGDPYAVVLGDGSRHDLQDVLQNELNALKACLQQGMVPPDEEGSVPASTEQKTAE